MAAPYEGRLSTRTGHSYTNFSTPSVDPRIHFENARIAPISAVMQNMMPARGNLPQVQVDWMERATLVNHLTLGATTTSGNDTVEIPAAELPKLSIGAYIYNRTKDVYVGPITEIDTGNNQITATNPALGSSAAAFASGDKCVILRGNIADNGAAPSPLVPQPDRVFNYIEYTSTTYGASELLQLSTTYGGVNTMEDLAPFMMINHDEAVEIKVLYGKRFLDTSGTHARYHKGGALEFITGQTPFSGTLTESVWNQYLEELFDKSGPMQRKQVFVPGQQLRTIQGFKEANNALNIPQNDVMKNVALTTYRSSFGIVDLIHHRFLSSDFGTGGVILGLDMEVLEWFDLQPTIVKENIQNNNVHGREDEIYQASSVKWINPPHHRICEDTS